MIRTITRRTPRTAPAKLNSARKSKKSYSLSAESVEFLEGLHRGRPDASVSSILDEILHSVRRRQERETLDRSVTSYYDSLTDAEVAEAREWGEFAMTQLPPEEQS